LCSSLLPPLVIASSAALQENPFYVAVEQFLARLREREAEEEAGGG
jgi:hypothetical protein